MGMDSCPVFHFIVILSLHESMQRRSGLGSNELSLQGRAVTARRRDPTRVDDGARPRQPPYGGFLNMF